MLYKEVAFHDRNTFHGREVACGSKLIQIFKKGSEQSDFYLSLSVSGYWLVLLDNEFQAL